MDSLELNNAIHKKVRNSNYLTSYQYKFCIDLEKNYKSGERRNEGEKNYSSDGTSVSR